MKHIKSFLTLDAFEAEKDALVKPYVCLLYSGAEGGNEPAYQMIDLGLPSGIKWANMNVGATSETDKGLYFQWGATDGYADGSHSWIGMHPFNGSPYKTPQDIVMGAAPLETAFSVCYTLATEDKNSVTALKPEYDAATANMGKGWRMPTQNEITELVNGTNKTWVTNRNGSGIDGYLFTSKTNGESIFIPVTGFCISGIIYGLDCAVYFWSSTSSYADVLSPNYHQEIYFDVNNPAAPLPMPSDNVYFSLAVRGVHA